MLSQNMIVGRCVRCLPRRGGVSVLLQARASHYGERTSIVLPSWKPSFGPLGERSGQAPPILLLALRSLALHPPEHEFRRQPWPGYHRPARSQYQMIQNPTPISSSALISGSQRESGRRRARTTSPSTVAVKVTPPSSRTIPAA